MNETDTGIVPAPFSAVGMALLCLLRIGEGEAGPGLPRPLVPMCRLARSRSRSPLRRASVCSPVRGQACDFGAVHTMRDGMSSRQHFATGYRLSAEPVMIVRQKAVTPAAHKIVRRVRRQVMQQPPDVRVDVGEIRPHVRCLTGGCVSHFDDRSQRTGSGRYLALSWPPVSRCTPSTSTRKARHRGERAGTGAGRRCGCHAPTHKEGAGSLTQISVPVRDRPIGTFQRGLIIRPRSGTEGCPNRHRSSCPTSPSMAILLPVHVGGGRERGAGRHRAG